MVKRKKKKGFTLVEMVIVLAIIAALVGIIAPNVINYSEKAKISADRASANTIATAINLGIANGDVTVTGTKASPQKVDTTSSTVTPTGITKYLGAVPTLQVKPDYSIGCYKDGDTIRIVAYIQKDKADADTIELYPKFDSEKYK